METGRRLHAAAINSDRGEGSRPAAGADHPGDGRRRGHHRAGRLAASRARGSAASSVRSYQSQAARRPLSRSHWGAQPSSARIAVESRNWRSISPCGTPVPWMSGSTSRPEIAIRRSDHVEHRVRLARPGVPGAAPVLAAVERAGHRQVGVGRVLHVDVVALRRPVRADHRPLAAHQRPRGVGNEPRPVHVARAVHVRQPRDRHRHVVGGRVGAGDHVGRRLRHVVRVRRLEREVLAVGQLVVRRRTPCPTTPPPPASPDPCSRTASSSM